MDWKGGRRSDNIEDRRDYSAAGAGAGLGLLLRFVPFLLQTKFGRGLLVVGVLGYFGLRAIGIDVLNLAAPPVDKSATQQISAEDKELVDFVSVVL
ncbi:MAG TPA: neutral zinc metallopeptidase, partial [Cellvibrio sp.]